VKRILRNYKLFGRIAAKKPMLSGRHIHNRIQWCKSYGLFHPSFWTDVTFSDECRVKIYLRKREYVRRQPGCRYDERDITKTVKYGNKSLMVIGKIERQDPMSIKNVTDVIGRVICGNFAVRVKRPQHKGSFVSAALTGDYIIFFEMYSH